MLKQVEVVTALKAVPGAVDMLKDGKEAPSVPTARQRKDHLRMPKNELERNTDLVENLLDWYELTPANLDHSFLFPETQNSKCPINKNVHKHSNEENAEYML